MGSNDLDGTVVAKEEIQNKKGR